MTGLQPPALPHAGPARFLTGVVRLDTDGALCEGRIPDDGPYVRDGRCPAFVLIEIAAQAAAALTALDRGDTAEPPPPGHLVRAGNIRLTGDDVAGGTVVLVRARRASSAPPLYVFDVHVQSREGMTLLDGRLGIHIPAGR